MKHPITYINALSKKKLVVLPTEITASYISLRDDGWLKLETKRSLNILACSAFTDDVETRFPCNKSNFQQHSFPMLAIYKLQRYT